MPEETAGKITEDKMQLSLMTISPSNKSKCGAVSQMSLASVQANSEYVVLIKGSSRG